MRAILLLLLTSCCKSPVAPEQDWTPYYRVVCIVANMQYIEGTRTCIGPDSTFMNLQPPK
jgi:hypothetical protein